MARLVKIWQQREASMSKLSLNDFIDTYKGKPRLCVFMQFIDYAAVKKLAKGRKLTLADSGRSYPRPIKS